VRSGGAAHQFIWRREFYTNGPILSAFNDRSPCIPERIERFLKLLEAVAILTNCLIPTLTTGRNDDVRIAYIAENHSIQILTPPAVISSGGSMLKDSIRENRYSFDESRDLPDS
jgi:hypothetical protein